MTYCLFSCLTHFLNTFTPFFILFVCSISEFELFQRMLHTNVWLKSPFYVRFVHLICKNQQEKPNAAGHPERPLDFPSKRSLNLHAPLRRLFAVIMLCISMPTIYSIKHVSIKLCIYYICYMSKHFVNDIIYIYLNILCFIWDNFFSKI